MRGKAGIVMQCPRVLVVDESTSSCLFIAAALREAGCEVDIALNGREGLTRVLNFPPECLILNVLLPGISGYALCRQVRQRFAGHTVCIILMGTRSTPLDEAYGLRQGADRYLLKPFRKETLIQAVGEGLPEPFRSAFLSTFVSHRIPASSELIPHRVPNSEAMRASNPFAGPTVIGDELARRLYAAIDGRKTIMELAAVTELEMNEVLRVLRVLLKEDFIQIYDSAGLMAESTLLLSDP